LVSSKLLISQPSVVQLLQIGVCLIFTFWATACSTNKHIDKTSNTESGIRIAFMSDVHLLDVYGTLHDVGYSGVKNPKTNTNALIRTMNAQLHSTRLFNENYFAFRAALDDAVQRGITLIALPGDFSDDGQPLNVEGLNRILQEYSEEHDISFFLTTGNHDPIRPFDMEAGKSDFLGSAGKAQPIMSEAGMYFSNLRTEHPTIISKDIKALGYEGIVNRLSEHGFFPKANYKYWATPFSNYTYETYSLERAKDASLFEKRKNFKANGESALPDVSYVVEPVNGIWVLALDANVYILADEPNQYAGAGIGYNEVLHHKQYLINWVTEIASEAKRLGKTLIAFSHYPMVDFNDGASDEISDLLGEDASQAYRIPVEKVAEVFADAGIQVHIGGHMHLNDTGIYTSVSGNTLVNIQVPSLAAYKPAYKIASIKADDMIEVKTVVLDSVLDFDMFFELYEEEYRFLKGVNSEAVWNESILKSVSYKEYTNWHLKELVRLRFLYDDWPKAIADFFRSLNGEQFLILSLTDPIFTKDELMKVLQGTTDSTLWRDARKKAESLCSQKGLDIENFKQWGGFDLIYDFYRLRSADKLALQDIGEDRVRQYEMLFESLENTTQNQNFPELWQFARIFKKQLSGEPANEFTIDLKEGKVTPK